MSDQEKADEPRTRRRLWVWAVVLPVVYVLSIGPFVWMTGFLVAGLTVPWRAMFAWLTHEKAAGDETLGVHSPMRRVA